MRSYFSSDDRRKIGQLLRETQQIDHIPCTGALDAAVLELRLIHRLQPRFNRQGKQWGKYSYVKLTLNERFPRLAVVRTARADGARYIGPLPSAAAAKRVIEAIETVMPLRRCSTPPGKCERIAPCAPAQLGVSTCPCSGAISEADYRLIVERTVKGITSEPDVLLEPLRAADDVARRRGDGSRRRPTCAIGPRRSPAPCEGNGTSSGCATPARSSSSGPATSAPRCTTGCSCAAPRSTPTRPSTGSACPRRPPASPEPNLPLRADLVDEIGCIARWLDAEADRVRVVHCDTGLASALPRIPSLVARSPNRDHGFDRAR